MTPEAPYPPGTSPDAGAVDAVTRGLDAVLGREVAMITLPPVSGPALLARADQVRRLAGLHHAHLLEVFDVDGLDDGTESTLVLQSVEGRALDAVADRGRWSSLAVAAVGAQTASALAHAHAHAVVHGGIGPASVVVDGGGATVFAWLTGFTAALHGRPAGATGTPPAAVTPQDDVVALGAVLTLVLDPDAFAATTLEQALTAMTSGRAAAAAAAESLAGLAESLRRADEDETGLVPLVAIPSGGPTPSTARGIDTAVPASGVGDAFPGRRSRLAGPGLRVAVLGAAAFALAATSGLVLWAGEASPVIPRPTGVPATPAPLPLPAPVVAPSGESSGRDAEVDERTTRRTNRSPITDVTTTTTTVPPTAAVPPRVAPPVRPPAVGPAEPRGPAEPPATGPTTGPTVPDGTGTTDPEAPPRAPGGDATLAAP